MLRQYGLVQGPQTRAAQSEDSQFCVPGPLSDRGAPVDEASAINMRACRVVPLSAHHASPRPLPVEVPLHAPVRPILSD
eukprot:931846-Alexandrium_andersonii.AAC.1